MLMLFSIFTLSALNLNTVNSSFERVPLSVNPSARKIPPPPSMVYCSNIERVFLMPEAGLLGKTTQKNDFSLFS
jgi:hypothetical protein